MSDVDHAATRPDPRFDEETGPDPVPPLPKLADAQVAAAGVCQAYAAYNNGSNLTPSLPGYGNIQTIWVHESDPNFFPSLGVTGASAGAAGASSRVAKPAAYADHAGTASSTCTAPQPLGSPSPGSQLFGFTATAADGSHNILCLRGTVTPWEAYCDISGWGSNTTCLLPSQSATQSNCGEVNATLYDFYTGDDFGVVTSLASSCMTAIQATTRSAPKARWILGAHSLGGAMLSLVALDGALSQAFGLGVTPAVFTFGSLKLGLMSFRQAYAPRVPLSYRIANLCDFVPSMVSLEPYVYPLATRYFHVGYAGTFVWQTWDDWGNHSLANVYQPMLADLKTWLIIKWGKRIYPQ